MAIASLVCDVVQRNALLATSFLTFLVLILLTIRYHRSPWRRLSPGPKGFPLLGNLHQLIHGKQWITFSKWKETYGPVFYLNAGGQPVIVLGSLKAAADLLDGRALIYSDRPRSIVASEMMAGGLVILLTGYNNLWKRMRKACHEELSKSVASRYQTIQSREAVVLTENLLTNEKDWINHFRRGAVSFIMSLVYGVPLPTSGDDAAVAKINDYVERLLAAVLPGAHLVKSFTWMKYIPPRFASWKRRALEQFQKGSEMFRELLDGALERKANGDDQPTLAARLFGNAARNQLSEEECSWLAGAMFGAGAETSAVVLEWWLLTMLIYPETQRRAQEEIDLVVGRDRLPTFADMKNMPYIQGMTSEVLRWGPVSPLGAPHCLMEEIHRDPATFGDDACHFNPERHLDEKGQISPGPADTKEEGHVSYGFGRRICVGRHVANNSLFINIATILWAANIERAKGENGELVKLDPDAILGHGFIMHPVPFDCKITPRSPDVLAVLHEARDT